MGRVRHRNPGKVFFSLTTLCILLDGFSIAQAAGRGVGNGAVAERLRREEASGAPGGVSLAPDVRAVCRVTERTR